MHGQTDRRSSRLTCSSEPPRSPGDLMTDVRTPPEAAPATGKKRQLPRGLPVFTVVAVAILAFLAGGTGSSYQSKLSDIQKNDNFSFLPGSAEATKVLKESAKFNKIENVPGFIVLHRPTGLTSEDKAVGDRVAQTVQRTPGVDTNALLPPQTSSDGTTLVVFTPLVLKQDGQSISWNKIFESERAIVDSATTGLPAGLQAYPAGQAGLALAGWDAFSGADTSLILVAVLVVIVILLFVYRSPVLWIFPIVSAVLALGLASLVVYVLAKNNVVTVNGQSLGIMPVLVLGAGTDYALLLVSRYREELHVYPNRFDAMIKAWRGVAPAIVASAATVILGLLCLTFSSLESNSSLGPVAAVGIACTLVVTMSFLPVALSLAGRGVFWPRKPRVDGVAALASHGFWTRAADRVDSRRRPAWIGVVVLLGICMLGLASLKTGGLSQSEGFTNTPDAVVGQNIYTEKFQSDISTPAVIVANASAADAVIEAVSKVQGVSSKPG